MQKQRKNKDISVHHFGLIKILIEAELQKIGITWEKFLITNEFFTDEEQKESQERQQNLQEKQHAEPVTDVDATEENFSEFRQSNSIPSTSSVRTRRMVREEVERANQDKFFTDYTRKSRKRKLGQQRKVLEKDDVLQQTQYDYVHGLEDKDKEKEQHEQQVSGKKRRRLEKKVEKLQQELKESEVLERVIKAENETLKIQSKKLQAENEKLKNKIKKLSTYKTQICRKAYKLYKQKKEIKTKYQILKTEYEAQMKINDLLEAAEVEVVVEDDT